MTSSFKTPGAASTSLISATLIIAETYALSPTARTPFWVHGLLSATHRHAKKHCLHASVPRGAFLESRRATKDAVIPGRGFPRTRNLDVQGTVPDSSGFRVRAEGRAPE
jgi:hypothetical protein